MRGRKLSLTLLLIILQLMRSFCCFNPIFEIICIR
jgi:hypothetical protein